MLKVESEGWGVSRQAQEEQDALVLTAKVRFWLCWFVTAVFLIFAMPDQPGDPTTGILLCLAWIFLGMGLSGLFIGRIYRLLISIHHHQVYPTMSPQEFREAKCPEEVIEAAKKMVG